MRAAARVLALIAGSIGLLVLAGGWLLDISFLRSIIPGADSMKFNTALSLMLIASAILAGGFGSRHAGRMAAAFATLVSLMALATLIEDLTGLNFGIDQFFVADRTQPVLTTAPGRMAVTTAIAVFLLGCAILLRTRRASSPSDQFLAIGAGVLCLANLVGYLYGIANFAGIAFYTGMAVHTSCSLLLLSISVLFSAPDRGLMALVGGENPGGVLARRLLPAVVIVPVFLGWMSWQGELNGLYGTAFGVAVFATANVVVFTCLTWATGYGLNRLDAAKAQATAMLRAREELLDIFVKHVPAAVAMLDRDMRYLQVSNRWLVDTGIGNLQILGKLHYEIFNPVSDYWKEVYRRGLAGESLKAEGDWIALDGKAHTIVREVHPWGDSGARTGGIIVFFEDITERKKEELELRKFVSLADNSFELIGMCDMNLMPFYANPAALQCVGLDSVEQASKVPVPQFFFPEDRPFITEEFFPRVIRDGHAEAEIRLRNFKTGKPLWMIYNVFFIKDAAGQPIGFATVSRDITERKRSEDVLRDRETTIRTLLDTAAQAILAVDATGGIVLANRMAGEMFGYSPDDLLGRSLEILLPERLRLSHAAHRAAFFTNLKTRPMGIGLELEGLRRDGSEFPIEVSLSSVNTSRGVLAVSFVSDITARKRAEMAFQDSEQQLRALAGSLITAQDDERRRLSMELHDDITQQLAFLSIELGRLAAQGIGLHEDVRERIRALQDRTLHVSAEVRRLSHGLHPSVIEDFGLSVGLEEFCLEYARAHGIGITFEGYVEDSRLNRDGATCLYRVVQESLRNAVTHGRANHIRVELTTDAGAIHLRVQDDGAGFVVDAARTRMGLGLISMRERIRLVKGSLEITSQPGQGTELTASVPFAERDPAAPSSGNDQNRNREDDGVGAQPDADLR